MSTASPYVLLCLGYKNVGTAKYFTGGSENLSRTLHGFPLHIFAKKDQDLVAVYSVQLFSEFLGLPYPYSFGGPEEPPKTLGDLNEQEGHFKSLIAWDNRHLVPHQTGRELGDSPRIVTAQDFFHNGRATAAERISKAVRWQDRAGRAEDFENESEIAGITENAAAAGSNASNYSHQHDRLKQEVSELPFYEGNPSVSLVQNRFSRLRKQRNSHSDPITNPHNTVNSEDESNRYTNAVQTSTHDLERGIRISRSAGKTQRESLRLSTELASTLGEGDHTGDAAEIVIHGTGGDSDSEFEDDTSSDDSVNLRSCSQIMPFPRKRA